jgi:hypothetical protein
MANDYTPECKACFDRGQTEMRKLRKVLAEAFPEHKDLDIDLCKNISSFGEIGTISLGLGDNVFRLRFKGFGVGSGWSRSCVFKRYKVDISNYGRFNDTQVFEKAGKLDHQKLIAVIKERHEEFVDKQKHEAKGKAHRAAGEKVIASLKSEIDLIKGCTSISVDDWDGSYRLTLTNLDEARLRRIVGTLTIHHGK